jgi:hypothetical protein
MAKAKVIQLFPNTHKKGKGPSKSKSKTASDAIMIGELFLLGLQFAIGISKDKFILGWYCTHCEAYHPLEDSYKIAMPAANHTPIDFLTCMMPYLNHLVVEHMIDVGVVQDNCGEE